MDLTLEETMEWLSNKLISNFQLERSGIDPDRDFSAYGLDSLNAVNMVGEIEQWIGKELPATALWDYTTIRLLAEFVQKEAAAVSKES